MKAKKRVMKKNSFGILLDIFKFLVVGYLLMNLTQAVFCGKQSADVCKAGIYFIPVWIIAGIVLLIYCKKK